MKLPSHIALIMDGNGRWAQARGRQRAFGHIKGALVARTIIKECARKGVSHLTLYAFSTENWKRPMAEVNFLMRLLSRHLERERNALDRLNVRFRCIGDLDRLPKRIREEIARSIQDTQKNSGMVLTFALSYGGRQEITDAAKELCRQVKAGMLQVEEVTTETFAKYLSMPSSPDPDLIIRTSGEFRLSNFLPWQSTYSELYFTNTLWPDFTVEQLDEAIRWYMSRERRFGQIGDQQLTPSWKDDPQAENNNLGLTHS